MDELLELIRDAREEKDAIDEMSKRMTSTLQNCVDEAYWQISTVITKFNLMKQSIDQLTEPQCFDLIFNKIFVIFEGYQSIFEGYNTADEDLRNRIYPKTQRTISEVHGMSPPEHQKFYLDFCSYELANLNVIVEESQLSMTPFLNMLMHSITEQIQSLNESFENLNNHYVDLSDLEKDMKLRKTSLERTLVKYETQISELKLEAGRKVEQDKKLEDE